MKKLIVVSSTLTNAMQTAKKVVSKKSVLPILECFLCEVKIENKRANLLVKGTDLENHISVSIHCEANEEFKFVIHSDELAFIEKLDEQPLCLEIDETTCEVRILAEGETVKAIGEKVEDYPITPNSPYKQLGYLSNEFFSELKTSLKYVADPKDINPKYKGVGIETTEEGIAIVGTDAFTLRLTNQKAEISNEAVGEKFVLNPTLCKLLASFKKVENIHISIMKMKSGTNTVLNFELNRMQVVIVSRNLDCDLVDYKRILPTYSVTTVSMEKKDLLKKIDKAMLYTNDSTHQGVFCINGKVVLTASELDGKKEYRSEFAHTAKEGEDIDISFNLAFLKKVLSDLNGDTVNLEMTESYKAAVIKEENTLTILMPIQL